MPTVFIYEFITAMGWDRGPNPSPLGREGRAMLDAIREDFARIPGMTVLLPTDGATAEHAFDTFEAAADFTLVIAPETDECLADLQGRVRQSRLLGCRDDGVRWCAAKDRLAALWQWYGVPTPRTILIASHDVFTPQRYPVVVKPRDGAGSGFQLANTPEEFRQAMRGTDWNVVQDFIPGQPASVAFLVNRETCQPLLPAYQHIDSHRHSYLGGELPLPPPLAERAIRLGRRALAVVPGLLGYVSVDLILGDAADGSADYAIEINPRLTTSYVGLRQLADFNLAHAILKVCTYQRVGELRWKPGRVQFAADGTFDYDASYERCD